MDAPAADLTIAPRPFYAAKAALARVRSLAWAARGGRSAPGLRILYYHRVSDERDELAVRPSRFREQIAALAAAGYNVVDVASAAALLRSGDPVTGVVALSFDDGYRDVAEHAVPVLAEHGFRATVFVATGVVDGTARFSWYEQQPPVMSWPEIAALDGGSLVFEAHTVTHPNLLALDEGEAAAEVVGSKRALEEHLGRAVSVFCYPAGLYDEREKRLARGAGFAAATSCEPGANTSATDPYELRRIQIDPRDRLVDFRAKVAGAHDRRLPLRALYRRRRYGAVAATAEPATRRADAAGPAASPSATTKDSSAASERGDEHGRRRPGAS